MGNAITSGLASLFSLPAVAEEASGFGFLTPCLTGLAKSPSRIESASESESEELIKYSLSNFDKKKIL